MQILICPGDKISTFLVTWLYLATYIIRMIVLQSVFITNQFQIWLLNDAIRKNTVFLTEWAFDFQYSCATAITRHKRIWGTSNVQISRIINKLTLSNFEIFRAVFSLLLLLFLVWSNVYPSIHFFLHCFDRGELHVLNSTILYFLDAWGKEPICFLLNNSFCTPQFHSTIYSKQSCTHMSCLPTNLPYSYREPTESHQLFYLGLHWAFYQSLGMSDLKQD